MTGKILIVEDESEIRELIALQLKRQGYAVMDVESAELALELLRKDQFAMIVLDWMLPGMSGRELTKTLRSIEKQGRRTPILFVTAKSEPADIVEGLDAGADDYLPKPFDNAVLLARVRALLRRNAVVGDGQGFGSAVGGSPLGGANYASGPIVKFGPLELDIDGFRARLDGAELELTRSEFRLLRTLMENQGKVFTRNQLIDQIQGEGVAVVGRTVDTHVFGLRKKLGRHADVIETVRGVGYRIGYLEPE